jgi:phosphate transport system substrate-binding protein
MRPRRDTLRSLKRRSTQIAAIACALALVGAACSDDDSSDTSTDGTGGGGGSSEIVISGSSTVEPISAAIAELFQEANPGVAISVDGPGTGDGFEIFCNGESAISDASRPIAEEEIAACEENDIEFIELKIAIDGLSVITSAENDAVECVSFLDLYALLGPESTGFNSWDAANDLAAEVGGEVGDEFGALNAPYPSAPLTVTAPGEESGTYDTFVELALEDIADERGVDAEARPDYTASPNDNVIVEGISGTATSLGWVGFAFVEPNLDRIQPLQVDGGDGCVEPTPETIASGEFPLARPLFIYVNKAQAEANPALVDYVDLYLSDEGLAVIGPAEDQVNYVQLETTEIEATREVWANRETGTREG